ncbi:CD109 antigen [Pantherophis guttatus]|uniref:CD109 antigen n=1 Tax=Pantherophis guttatus TaxID=94885 RepID=A0A6P9CX12_PANGU|nr:CD109 antigen [Pantherophis guttatus]
MQLLMEVVPATRRSSWLFPILPFIWGFVIASSLVNAGPTYLLAVPKIIRPGANLTIGVRLLKESPSSIRIQAQVLLANKSILQGEAVFQRDSFSTLVLPSLPLGSTDADYELLVNGYSKEQLLFSNRTSLPFASKSFSVFIQTDKAMYKPGQEVKIRVVTLHSDLKPYNTPVNIYIQDPQRNLIQQWLTQNGKLGKIAKHFKLSKHPLLGDWSIEVQVNGQAYYQSFAVMEYVAPKFEVYLTTPTYYSMQSMLNGTITAKYVYGKPMKGKVTIDFFSLFRRQNTKITKIMEINGSLNFTLESSEIKYVTVEDEDVLHPAPIEIIAVVTESLTGISQNASATVFPQLHDYALDFVEYPRFLKPSLNFIAMLKVRRTDNHPLTSVEQKNNVTITVTQSKISYQLYENELQKKNTDYELNYPVPENGIIQIDIPVSANTTVLYIKAEFLESQTFIKIHDVFYSPSLSYLQIRKTSKDLKVGVPLELSVQSSMPLNEINYMVMSRGQIVDAGKKKTTTFSLIPENSWAPTACIIVFYVHENGEIINDALHIPIQLTFKNQINMHWSKNKAGPAEDITLNIKVTEPQTSVGLLVIDKSINLLGKRNDITEDAIHHELNLYDTKPSFGEAGSAFSVFQNNNLWIWTDANLSEHEDYDGVVLLDYDFDYDTDSLSVLHEYIPALNEGNLHVRKNFPETWLWQEIMTRSTEATINVTVPDTITSWVASAFIISENLGLGVMKIPIELEVFQPFFVSLNLPPSVIRGEQFILEVNIFNYLKESTEVTVILDTSDSFEIFVISNDINAIGNQHTVWIPSEDGKTVFFPIMPKQIGEIPIRVTAISTIASDAILQRLLVKAEGLEQTYSETVLLDLSKRTNVTEILNFNFPSDVVPGSERVQVTVTGDKLSSSISGLESLVKMPYGCGEQNMINFAPNIYILDYLSKAGNLQTQFKSKIVSYMREGYQRELLYKRPDGSFSAFGNSDPSGSTWLSAFVLRSFIQAQPYIDIDPYIPERTAAWILSHQKLSGDFEEPGRVLHTELQGGTSDSVSRTAYILTALLEYQFNENDKPIKTALGFLEFQLNNIILDNHTLALVTYALSLAKSTAAKGALDKLNERSERQGELRFWTSSSSGLSSSWQPRAADIEVAGYALLSHFIQRRLLEGIPIMKWLSKQRNHLGGYSSTQDTIVALQALSTFATLTADSVTEIDVTVNGSMEENPTVFRIDHENRLVLKTKEFPAAQPVRITISANGRGFAIFQLNVIYNVKNSHTSKRRRSAQNQEAFDLDVYVKDDKEDINSLTLNVCTRYLGTGSSSRTGMALMEIGLLSGFSLSPSFVSLADPVKKVEKEEGKIHLYLDSLNETQVCVDIPAVRDFKVANTQDASVTVMDYYEPRRRTVKSYNSQVMQSLSSCTFCEDDECNFCKTGGSLSVSLSSELLVLLVLSTCYIFI